MLQPRLSLGTPLVTLCLHGKGARWCAGTLGKEGTQRGHPHTAVDSGCHPPLSPCCVPTHTHTHTGLCHWGCPPSVLSVTSGYRDQCGPQCSVVPWSGWLSRATPCRVTCATCHRERMMPPSSLPWGWGTPSLGDTGATSLPWGWGDKCHPTSSSLCPPAQGSPCTLIPQGALSVPPQPQCHHFGVHLPELGKWGKP